METGSEIWTHKMPELGEVLVRDHLVQTLYSIENPEMPQH